MKKLLLLVFPFLLLSVHGMNGAATALAAAPALAQEAAATHPDYFDSLLKIIGKLSYECTMNDWANYAANPKDIAYRYVAEASNCYNSATMVMNLFTKRGFTVHDLLAPPVHPQSTMYHGCYKKFLATQANRYQEPLAQDLFSHATASEHSVFFIYLDLERHSFVVEKYSDGVTTRWRVYQAYQGDFTLAQWLAIHRWPQHNLMAPNLEQSYSTHGQGKWLTQEEVQNFLFLQPNTAIYGEAVQEILVKKYTVRPNINSELDDLYHELVEQQQQEDTQAQQTHVMVQRRPRPGTLINGLGLMLIAAAAVFGTHECPCAATAAGGTGLAVLLSKNFWLQQLQKMGMTL